MIGVKDVEDVIAKMARIPSKSVSKNDTEALKSLRENPMQPFVRYEDVDGRPSLRYAAARIMAEACVKCHNDDPESTKRDWKVGDVRGVVEIIHPLDRDEARMRSGLLASFGWAGGIFLALLGFAAILLLRAERRNVPL